MAEVTQKESEKFETDLEVVIAKVIKNVGNEHQGIASRAVRDSPA